MRPRELEHLLVDAEWAARELCVRLSYDRDNAVDDIARFTLNNQWEHYGDVANELRRIRGAKLPDLARSRVRDVLLALAAAIDGDDQVALSRFLDPPHTRTA